MLADSGSSCAAARPRWRRHGLALLALLAGLGLSASALARRKHPAAPHAAADAGSVSDDCYAKVGPLLQSAGGSLTPKVRNAYLDWAEETVLEKLRQSSQSVPEDCLAEARREGMQRDALFGSVFPPDPSILQNYAQLRAELGEAFWANISRWLSPCPWPDAPRGWKTPLPSRRSAATISPASGWTNRYGSPAPRRSRISFATSRIS